MINQFSNLIQHITKRQSLITEKVRGVGMEILDIYHGEMAYSMHPKAQEAVLQVTKKILSDTATLGDDNNMYSKSQPTILRQLAAEKLYPQMLNGGINIAAGDVIVCPYSSIIMLETALMTLAKPNGIILCPNGFYKSNALHIEKFGMQLKCFEADLDQDGRINAQSLKLGIQKYRSRLCGVLFTMPGNPLNPDYSQEELNAIGRVLVKEGVKVIVDAAFTGIQNEHQPLATVVINHSGKQHLLHDQTLTITGLSKGHHASGPYKIGVATSGNQQWLSAIKKKLVVSFQRETTAFARVIIEKTPLSYLLKNQQDMMEGQRLAKQHFATINSAFGKEAISYFGQSMYGPFILLNFHKDILDKAGIQDGWQLADMLLASVGLNTVAGPRMGIEGPCVRININAPRKNGIKHPKFLPEVFARLKEFVEKILYEDCTYNDALSHIGIINSISVHQNTHLTSVPKTRPQKVL